MKCHPIAGSVVLGMFMSLVATVSNAVETAPASEVMPIVAAVSGAPEIKTLPGADDAVPTKTSLTAEELTALRDKEAQSPELLKQVAAGCERVWDPNVGEYGTVCRSAVQEGIMGGLIGVLIGSLGGAGGAAAGGAIGFVWFYATDGQPLGN
jgi:hypothetical protein